MDEKGLKCVFFVSGAGWVGDKVVRWMSGLEDLGKELCGEQGKSHVWGELGFLCGDAQ